MQSQTGNCVVIYRIYMLPRKPWKQLIWMGDFVRLWKCLNFVMSLGDCGKVLEIHLQHTYLETHLFSFHCNILHHLCYVLKMWWGRKFFLIFEKCFKGENHIKCNFSLNWPSLWCIMVVFNQWNYVFVELQTCMADWCSKIPTARCLLNISVNGCVSLPRMQLMKLWRCTRSSINGMKL